MGTAERRYEIMKILCRRRYETIRNLASEFGVSMRTVQRDIEALSRTEPIYTQFGKYGGGVYVVEGYSMDRMYMKKQELDVLQKLYIAADGQSSLLAACADFTFFMKDGVLAADSPLVISAKSGKNLPKEEVGGAAALDKANIVSFIEEDMSAVREKIAAVIGVLPFCGALVEENGSDLNAAAPALNENCTADGLIAAVFDKDAYEEFGKDGSALRPCVGTRGNEQNVHELHPSADGRRRR